MFRKAVVTLALICATASQANALNWNAGAEALANGLAKNYERNYERSKERESQLEATTGIPTEWRQALSRIRLNERYDITEGGLGFSMWISENPRCKVWTADNNRTYLRCR